MTADGYCLQLDVGNSSAKWRLQSAGHTECRGWCTLEEEESLAHLQKAAAVAGKIWVSSVAAPAVETLWLEQLGGAHNAVPMLARTESSTAGLVNSYSDPSRMGVDRWLAMLAAWHRRRERVLVVDAGSAVTIDLVAQDGHHEGGYIIPGPRLMEESLLSATGRVRFGEEVAFSLAPGRSTAEAVRHGIAASLAGAVRLVLEQSRCPPHAVLICGGAGPELARLLDMGPCYVEDLVFEGLEVMAQSRGW